MNPDGWVIIGNKMDTKELEKNINKSLRELQGYEKEAERLTTKKAKAEVDLQPYREEIGVLQEQIDEQSRLKLSTEERNANERYFQRMLDNINMKYKEQIETYETINSKIKDNAEAQERVKNRVKEMNDQLKNSKGFDIIKGSIDNIGNSMNGIINKVVRWGLAVFGIRSAYMGIRRIISLVSSENEGIANSIQQMKAALASAFLPLVQTIINGIAKIMIYINYIWKALTGKNLFNFAAATKNSADSLKSGAGSSGKIAKNLKDARKQLAGFDEMNVLSDNTASTGGTGGSGGTGGISDTDFPNIFDKLKKMKMPKWVEDLVKVLKKIKQYWKELIPIAAAFAGILLALKIAPFIHAITGATTALAQFKFGLALAVAGVILLVGEIINMILNWDKMTTKQKVLSVALAALGAAFIALGYAIATGISVATLGIGALIALVVGLIATLVGYIAKLATEEKAIKSVKKATDDLRTAKEKLKQAEDEYVNAVDNASEKLKALKDIQDKTGISGKELYKKVQDGTLDYKNMTEAQKKVYKAYLDNLNAQKQLKDASDKLAKSKQNVTDKTWEQKLAVAAEKGEYDKYRNSVVKAYQDGKISAKDAQKYISKAMTDMSKDSEKTFTKDIPDDIKKGLDPDKYRTTWQKFKSNWKENVAKLSTRIVLKFALGPTSSILKQVGQLGQTLAEKLKEKLNIKTSGKKSAKGAIVKLPKLAVGGIVNQPGRGVPIGNAITGEAGAEGVIPLTDSQQMALLGEAIGKYITINATIVNTMNGRVINRELKKVQNEDNFAFNR